MSEYKLAEGIIALSGSSHWDSAKLEWKLDEIYEADEKGACLCGHYPIIETCVLINKQNSNLAVVGNCCVKKFIGLPSDKIFQAIKRVRKDNEKSLNAEAIEYAYEREWINDWERDFYLDIMRKRKLTSKQLNKKTQINEKLSENMKRRT
ncbi:MAG: Zn-dependent oligopeptidase [Aestuariibacter sp.]|nr:Zn-dependent oligopeptidase [Aestuariibacter sp.]